MLSPPGSTEQSLWWESLKSNSREPLPPYDLKPAAVARNSLNTTPPLTQWRDDRRKEQCLPDALWTLGALGVCRESYSPQHILGIPMFITPTSQAPRWGSERVHSDLKPHRCCTKNLSFRLLGSESMYFTLHQTTSPFPDLN